MAEKSARGDVTRKTILEMKESGRFVLIDPLDYMLLGFLPDEGSLFAGLYPNGETVKNLLQKFTPEQRKALPSTMLSSRLRVMNLMGLVVPKVRASQTAGAQVWQITKEGKKVLRDWKEAQNGGGGNHVG